MSTAADPPPSVSEPDHSQPTGDESPPGQAAPSAPSASRRRLLGVGAALAAAALLPAREAAAQRVVRPHTLRPKPPPAPGDSLVRLVRRATNGLTAGEVARARSMGFRAYLEWQLKPQAIDDSEVERFVGASYPALAQQGVDLYQQDQNVLLRQLQDATLYRAAFSRRQLYERMVEFWTHHFSIYYPDVNYLKLLDDRDVIRKHALGKFPDLLRASAHSPAMLEYLDNTRSRVGRVNQNYARELMELHTLGVDGGYTQKDVEEVTRCLTGWTIAGRGEFRFDPSGHDFAAKVVLGQTIPAMSPGAGAAGIQDGEKVLSILLAHPSTARYIATKMIRWLLQYDPPAPLVARVAATFARTGGDIPAMIRDILTPANLMAAPAKYRPPAQLVVASLRATLPSVRALGSVRAQLGTMGQQLFLWETPDGYPDNVDWWGGTILQRWNFTTYLTGLSTGDVVFDVNPFLPGATPASVATVISQRAFGGEMSNRLREHIVKFLSAAPISAARVREAFALALGSTDFQWF